MTSLGRPPLPSGDARRDHRLRVRAVGQDRRPGRRRRRAGPRARPDRRGPDAPGRRLPAALSGDDPARRRAPAPPDPRCPTRSSPIGTTEVTVVDVVSHGYRLRLVDHPPAFDRAGYYGDRAAATTPTTPGASGSSAGPPSRRSARRPAGRRPPRPRLARRAGGRPARPVYADDPLVGPRGRAHHDPQPGLPRLGPARPAWRARASRPATASWRADAAGIDLLRAGIERPSWSTPSARATPPSR